MQTRLSSATSEVIIGYDQPTVLIGERINPAGKKKLAEKQEKLQQTMSLLDEGLKNHFAYEEETLPSLLGELFMRALILDHREIEKEIDKAKLIVAKTRLEGLSREELLSRELHIQQMINNICRLVEEHATNEEILLEMLKRALESKS